uniref:Uncharacterized protein n=1 Tax=Anguilla anguilla TaxID=7936 RepID=A0A0E9V8R6_ANGAN
MYLFSFLYSSAMSLINFSRGSKLRMFQNIGNQTF